MSSPDIVNRCASVTADLKAAGVGQSTVNSVVNSMEEFMISNSELKKLSLSMFYVMMDKLKCPRKSRNVLKG